MDYKAEYKAKLTTAEEAVKLVKSGDWVDYSTNMGFPVLLDKALAERKDELYDVKVRGLIFLERMEILECDPTGEHFIYNSFHMNSAERKYCDRGLCYFIPMLYRNLPSIYRNYCEVNVAFMAVPPMDEDGYFNFSINGANARAVFDVADKIVLEINENLPKVYGTKSQRVHISEVSAIVEGEHGPLHDIPSLEPTEVDYKIADYIVSRISDGACIQLGVGGMPEVIGKQIALSDLKNLGCHSELVVTAHYDMYKAGKLTNQNKSGEFKGKSVYGLAYGSSEMYEWLRENPDCVSAPIDYVNNPRVISEIDNFVSINNCIGIDLYGQVSSESAGHRHISGTGGQLDFLDGAYSCPNGQSFICFSSTFTDKKGVMHSRINPEFKGDIITDPRSQAQYFVTEYGIENMAGCATWQRAEKIIGLAHPDFREELIKSAEEYGIWRRSNKR